MVTTTKEGDPVPSLAQRAYVENAVETATPAQRLLILLDRLEANLVGLGEAFQVRDLEAIHLNAKAAQAALALLRGALREDVWEHASTIATLYSWALERLVRANVDKDPVPFEEARSVLVPLIAAWRQAATEAPSA